MPNIMSQVHTFSLDDDLTPSAEIFCIDAPCPNENGNVGWYYQMSVEGRDIGVSRKGPFI